MRRRVTLLWLLMVALPAHAAEIKSGASSDLLTIDPTSKAARVSLYDSRGAEIGQKRTYSAATTLKTATAAGTGVFFEICGSGTTTVRVHRIGIAGTVATAAVYGDLELKKYSAQTTGGTATALTPTPHDSTSAAATVARVNYYTVLATAGTLVGTVWSETRFFPITGTIVHMNHTIPFYWRDQETEGIVLRGTTQCLGANFGTTTTNAPTLTVTVVWTEE